jgi:phospholipid-transporting ATPase
MRRSRPYPPIVINNPHANSLHKRFVSNEIRTTKYTLLTFVPLNLFEQFRRATNIYLLLIAIITLIPQISPLTPVTSVAPLVFVVLLTGLKEAIEDYRRYKADKQVNNRVFLVYRKGKWKRVKAKKIVVGDLIKIEQDQEVPADMIIINSSNQDGVVYVETANLDGETNLKTFRALPETANYQERDIIQMTGTIEAERPTNNLYSFKGNITTSSIAKTGLNEKQLLLRGARVRNTQWAYCIVVYTGKNTKLSLNSRKVPLKFSRTEVKMNNIVIGIFVFTVVMCIVCAILAYFFQKNVAVTMWYLLGGAPPEDPSIVALKVFFAYFALFSYFIPASLVVTFELIKWVQAAFMMWDLEMRVDNRPMIVKNSNLNDELCRTEFIFCDKTGTLTENKMEFRQASIRGVKYDSTLKNILNEKNTPEAKSIKKFFVALALCNTVVPSTDAAGENVYQGSSPDEVALCNAAKDNDFVILKKTNDGVVLKVLDQSKVYKLLHVLEFSSERRRMSVIVRTPKGKIKLISKGADTTMFERLRDCPENKILKEQTDKHLKEFGELGYRTLVVCEKIIDPAVYTKWDRKMKKAQAMLDDRDVLVDKLQHEMEQDLLLLGATAIEDRLGPKVPESIQYLREAGIKVWVITGDKQETAINIGYSCRLLTKDMTLNCIRVQSGDECEQKLRSAIADIEKNEKMALVIDGISLGFALAQYEDLLLKLSLSCAAVICCRTTPLQKAAVVKMVRKGTKEICLAIGDGANDVSMIQEANIGVGIFGKEGTQAARAADYAIHQFSHLLRLMMVHGRYAMVRTTSTIYLCFYKNLALFVGQLWFAIYCGFSGQTFYDDYMMALFNTILTSLPPFLLGIFEKDIPEEVIEAYPQSYRQIRKNAFSFWNFVYWALDGVYQSLVIFYSVYFLFTDDVVSNGPYNGVADLYYMASYASSIGIITVMLRIAMETRHWTIIEVVGIVLSLIAFIAVLAIEGSVVSIPLYQVFVFDFSSATFYLMIVIVPVMCLLPTWTIRYVRRQYWPEDWHILLELHWMETQAKKNDRRWRKKNRLPLPDATEEFDNEEANDKNRTQNENSFDGIELQPKTPLTEKLKSSTKSSELSTKNSPRDNQSTPNGPATNEGDDSIEGRNSQVNDEKKHSDEKNTVENDSSATSNKKSQEKASN